MPRRTLAIAALLVVAATATAQVPVSPLLDHEAPAFKLPALGGGSVDLADLRGKIVVLHFGAGW